MIKIVYIYYMISGNIYQEIEYNDFNDLKNKLKLLIYRYDSDILIQLFINENILNNFDIINNSVLSKLNDNYDISIIFNNKKTLYCLGNEHGKYMLKFSETDNYTKILWKIITFYKKDSYDIIMNSSYKNLILKAVIKDGITLLYADKILKNDKEVVLEAVKQNGYALQYVNNDLQNDKEVVLEAVKQNGYALQYVNNNLQNDKEIILEAVKQNKYALQYVNIDLHNDKEIILKPINYNNYI